MHADRDTELEPRLIKALGHPLRQRILELLNEKEASPNQLASRIGEPLQRVAYHVRILLDYDAIELTRTEPVRGAREHFYRAIARPYLEQDDWAQLPLSVRRALFNQTLQGIWEHAVEGAKAEGFDAVDAHVSWTSLELDDQAREEVSTLLADTVRQVLDLQAQAAGRLVELPIPDRVSTRTEMAILHYDRP